MIKPRFEWRYGDDRTDSRPRRDARIRRPSGAVPHILTYPCPPATYPPKTKNARGQTSPFDARVRRVRVRSRSAAISTTAVASRPGPEILQTCSQECRRSGWRTLCSWPLRAKRLAQAPGHRTSSLFRVLGETYRL